MNKSIRSKLFLSVTFLLFSFIFLLWFMNNQFLNSYYIKTKKNILKENVSYLDSIYKGNINDIETELDKVANKTSSNIDIRDSDKNILYSTGKVDGKKKDIFDGNNRIGPPIPGHMDNIVNQSVEGKYTFEIRSDDQMKIDFLTLTTKLNNGDMIFIRVPLLSIQESVEVANKFIIITGLIVILLGSGLVFLYAKRFTAPILELNAATESMARFDFTKKCSVKGKDEIAQLASNINYLSSELDRTITELNEKNAKLKEDIERERKIDEMRKEFVSSVSHELRTPIAVIQGYAEGLISNVIETDEDREFYCNVIMKEADKMNKLVKDLLNLSQIESGYFHVEKSEFDVNSLIEYILNKYKNNFIEKNIRLEFKGEGSLIGYGDIIRIEQVITNFITNAINHIDGERVIKIFIHFIEDKIRIFVYNTGKHIPEDSLDKIWKSFYKVDKARTRAYGGYGLGLSIVRAIQEVHHNKYGVENVEGGVEFWFDVDLAEK